MSALKRRRAEVDFLFNLGTKNEAYDDLKLLTPKFLFGINLYNIFCKAFSVYGLPLLEINKYFLGYVSTLSIIFSINVSTFFLEKDFIKSSFKILVYGIFF